MSRYTRTTNPHDLFEDNVHEANGLRDKKALNVSSVSAKRERLSTLSTEKSQKKNEFEMRKKPPLETNSYKNTPTTSNKNTKTLTITKEEKTREKSQLKSEAKIDKSPVKPTMKSAMA